jgi:nucleotide-binding universal stress UspA family protein
MGMSRTLEKFSKTLVAIDGSELAMAAADYAISIVVHHYANLIVLHVLPAGIKRAYFDYKAEDIPVWIRTNLLEYKREVEGWFCRIKDKYQKQKWEYQQQQHENGTATINLKIDIVDLITSVAGTIVSYAEEESIDLIVIGTKGTSRIKKMLIGSVARSCDVCSLSCTCCKIGRNQILFTYRENRIFTIMRPGRSLIII